MDFKPQPVMGSLHLKDLSKGGWHYNYALVRTQLTGMCGGARCLEVSRELFPGAALFTLLLQVVLVLGNRAHVSCCSRWLCDRQLQAKTAERVALGVMLYKRLAERAVRG